MGSVTDINLDLVPTLPIAAHEAEIARLIDTHQVLIVAGETGSGKTTQLPKICLKMGRRAIGHTQPRRIAAHAVASRIATETGTELGDVVGYQVRFTAAKSAATQLKLMTDGILLAEIAHDRLLRRYDTIIIDEAHERSLNIDFLLGYLKQTLPRRPDLKVIITSATIDTARFSAHFDDAPVVEVSGRGYPVEVRYAPMPTDADPIAAIVAAVQSLPRVGDILVFCSGEREIKDVDKAIRAAKLRDVEVLPLFARLSIQEQARVFAPHAGQRVVVATNVAETSLTVPGTLFVVDPGFARVSRYSARTKMQRLPIEPISQASANQRAGRCGRVAPGVCVRLYSEEDFHSRPAYTEPEILRTNLASVILAMANAHLGQIADFPFLDPPDQSKITDGLRLLAELGALRGDKLTSTGRKLATLPIDPRLGRILLEASKQGCLKEALIIVAGLSVPDVRARPLDHREEADRLHARFYHDDADLTGQSTHQGTPIQPQQPRSTEPGQPARITPHTGWGKRRGTTLTTSPTPAADPGGDFAALMRLWSYLRDQRRALSGSQFRRLCQSEYINYLRVGEWQDLIAQLRQMCSSMKLPMNSTPAPISAILSSCLSGLLSNIGALDPTSGTSDSKGRRRGPKEYLGTRGARFAISPGSALATSAPELVMAAQLVETTRGWAHTVAAVTPEQVEAQGAHMVKRTYSEPFFSSSTGTVMAHEKVHLLGVPLIADRRVGYSGIDPEAARQVFINALVEGLCTPRPGTPYARVADHNGAVRSQIEDLEDKARRRGVVVDDTQVFAFFDSRIPASVASVAQLDSWLRSSAGNSDALMMQVEDLLGREPEVTQDDYPDMWAFGTCDLGLDYHFSPGSARDGVTVKVPLASLGSLDPAPFTWGIPGARLELATELIRTLPKAVRTRLVPAPDWARRGLDWLEDHGADQGKPFPAELSRALTALLGDTVAGWDTTKLPPHLQMGFLVGDGADAPFSRDLESLQVELGRKVRKKLETSSPRKRASGTTWVFGVIPQSVTIRDHGVTATGYPALSDAGDRVVEVLESTEDLAKSTHSQGIARLAWCALPEPYRWIVAHMTNADKIALAGSPYPSVPDLLADARVAGIRGLVSTCDPWLVRDQASFTALVDRVRPDHVESTHQIVLIAAEALRHLSQARQALDRLPPGSDTVVDVQAQLDNLVFPGFLSVIEAGWLKRLPIWLKGVVLRCEAAAVDLGRDQSRLARLDPILDAYATLLDTHPGPSGQIDRIGYLIEELRLQLFAQTLRTVQTVSEKRIAKAIAEVTEAD